ncbi:MAG TPA: tRNA epoxyqueuosine(34) reductase QueG [Phycisphaerales bacterium]|nr:tRNA epoxyqueuosine(34) reductase QueG [Phycisphaerales bacterium]
MGDTPGQRAAKILEMCRGEGFALAGAARLAPGAHARELREWLGAGKHGEMAWLAKTVEERLDPARLLAGAQSVVMVADFYAARGAPADPPAQGFGRIARYARGRDYHDVIKRRVQRVCDRVRETWPGAATKAFTDTAPAPERELAALCGLGWIGKHTLLIHPAHGSWMLLGGFLTTLVLEAPGGQAPEPGRCGTCTRCIDACPTGAITPHSVDASRCISYLTIEHLGPVGPALAGANADWLVGCDVCQEVCPHNSARPGASGGGAPVRAEYAARRAGFDLLEVLGWDEPTRRARFATSAMKRVTLAQIKRNAVLLAAGLLRSGAPAGSPGPGDGLRDALRDRLVDIAWDAGEPEPVRDAARAALAGLSPAAPPGAR